MEAVVLNVRVSRRLRGKRRRHFFRIKCLGNKTAEEVRLSALAF